MKVKWIMFNEDGHDESKNYYPELYEVIALILLSPLFWLPLFILLIKWIYY